MEWLSPDGRKAIEIMGWPEWRDDYSNTTQTLVYGYYASRKVWGVSGQPSSQVDYDEIISPREALALLRDQARACLNDHTNDWHMGYCDLSGEWHGSFMVERGDRQERVVASAMDEDAFYIRAILAVHGEKHAQPATESPTNP